MTGTYISSVDNEVIPTAKACCLPSAIIACENPNKFIEMCNSILEVDKMNYVKAD